jgi:hypothetical protein
MERRQAGRFGVRSLATAFAPWSGERRVTELRSEKVRLQLPLPSLNKDTVS